VLCASRVHSSANNLQAGTGFRGMSEVRNENTIGDRSIGPRAWGGQPLGVHEQRLQERPAWLVPQIFDIAQGQGAANQTYR
jgi:hypothetical protein